MQVINSIKDACVIEARSLTAASARAQKNKCQLQGKEHLEWALTAGLELEYVFVSEKYVHEPLIRQLEERNILCLQASEGIMKKITETNYLVPIVGIALIKPKNDQQKLTSEILFVLDHVQDHGNLGTIVRTAAAFGINTIITTDEETDFWYKKVIDSSRGRVFAAHIRSYGSVSDTIKALKNAGYQIVATSPHAKTLQSLVPIQHEKVALVLGNETNGISDELMAAADTIVQIPMNSEVESLNVAVAGGISIYEIKVRMVLAMLTEKIRGQLGRTINVTSKMIQEAFDRYLHTITQYTATQVILLMILKCDQWMSYEQAGKDTQSFDKELEHLLAPLLADALIAQEMRNAIQGIKLTYKGEDFIAKIMIASEKLEANILEGFSENEKLQLGSFFERIQENCIKVIEGK